MGTTTETRITSTQAKDAIYKAHSISSSASEIDEGLLTVSQKTTLESVPPRTANRNMFNILTKTDGFFIDSSGNPSANASYSYSAYIEVIAGKNYVANQVTTFSAFYDSNKTFLSRPATNIQNWTAPVGAKYIRVSLSTSIIVNNYQFEVGNTSTKYIQYKEAYTIKYLDITNTPTVITASISDTSANFVGRRAIQDAIDSVIDANATNRYLIDVWSGVYSATEVSHFDKNESGMMAFIMGKNHVDIKCRPNVFITGYLPNNLGAGFAYSNYQTVLWNTDDAVLEGATITMENGRYPIHIDNPLKKDYSSTFKGCIPIHKGNTGHAVSWTSWNPIGIGTASGQQITIEDSKIVSASMHNNSSFSNPSLVKYKNCSITGNENNSGNIIIASSYNSGQKDVLLFENCDIAEGYYVGITTGSLSSVLKEQKADRVDIEVIARDNAPTAVNGTYLNGVGLKITSKTTGSSSSVSFDQTSTAFPLIISTGINSASYENRYLREVIYGYEKFKGGNGLSGYAIGSLDISDGTVGSSQYITSLGKRLGDCSTVNKTLTVIIDGTSYNIVFNKNYNNTTSTVASTYTNTQIIAEITSVIGSVATVGEYIVGKDYFPIFKGNIVRINADTTEILAGMGVVFVDSGIRKALNSDGRIDGIALDNCIVGGKSRVITCGQIYTRNSGQRFSIQQSTSTATTYGTKLGMSTTDGVFEIGATPTLLSGVGANMVKFI